MQTICITEGSIVKRVSLAVAAVALLGAAACQDAVTSPQPGDLRFFRTSNPPPPPIDTGSTGSFVPATDLRAPSTPRILQPRFSIVQSSSPAQRTKFSVFAPPNRRAFDFTQNSFFFSVPITYLFNPTSKAGYIHFSNDADGVNSSSNGMIKNKNGVLSGKGTLQIQTTEGLLVIDLSSIEQPPSFQGCTAGPDAPTQNDGGVCFFLHFDSATLDGVPGSVNMSPGCDPTDFANDETESCFSD